MNDPNYRHHVWRVPRSPDERWFLDEDGLLIKQNEKVTVDVRDHNDPLFGRPGRVTTPIDDSRDLATVTFDDGGSEEVPRRALRRA
jgi:hypothetical protein